MRRFRVSLILLLGPLCFAMIAWSHDSGRQTQSSATQESEKAKPQQPQTAPSPQSQAVDDDVPRTIIETPQSKNTTTISTPIGLKETNERMNDTYSRVSKKVKDQAVETRRSIEKSEAAGTDAQNKADDQEDQAEKKPPKF